MHNSNLLVQMFRWIQFYWWQITLVLLGIVTYSSLTPLPELPGHGSDKIAHLIAYSALALPVALRQPKCWWCVIVMLVMHGAAIELIQPSVNRMGEWGDWFADVTGVLLGILVALFIRIFLIIPKR